MKSIKWVLFSMATSILGAIIGVWIYSQWIDKPTIYRSTIMAAQQAAEHQYMMSDRANKLFRTAAPTDFIQAAQDARQAVVFIESEITVEDNYYARILDKSTGSGVLLSNDGYIVTNRHVIEGAETIHVTLSDNREFQAELIGSDEQTDLALLKIEQTSLPYLIFGNSDSLKVGEWVLAVGNPFRLQSSVTAGIVSAKARNINILEQQGIESFIQTDAAVNPGNSGGALINTRGELVGINTAILSSSGGYEGFSFAVPSILVKKVIRDLQEYGAVQRGWMGVTIYDVDATMATAAGLDQVEGVVIDAMTQNGAAKEAGLQRGDILLAINDTPTPTMPIFMERIGQYRPGDEIMVTTWRDGALLDLPVTLRNQLNTTDYVAIRKDKILTDLGFELRNLDSSEKSRLKASGAKVVSVLAKSKIAKANIEPGYIITSINGREIEDVEQLINILKKQSGTIVLNGYYENYPGEFPYTFSVK